MLYSLQSLPASFVNRLTLTKSIWQTASMTSLTAKGGDFIDLTSVMSFLVRVSRAWERRERGERGERGERVMGA